MQSALTVVEGDVADREAVERVVASGFDAIVLGAAITAGPARDAADPESILQVNLLAQVPVLMAARRNGVTRVINLSSAAAYGAAVPRQGWLDEETVCDPVSLYAITKYASEKVAARLAALWPVRYHQRAAERRVRAVGAGDGIARYAKSRRCRSLRHCTTERGHLCRVRASRTGSMRRMSAMP